MTVADLRLRLSVAKDLEERLISGQFPVLVVPLHTSWGLPRPHRTCRHSRSLALRNVAPQTRCNHLVYTFGAGV
jgi:hypothetical protein